jgi:NAD(P)H-nitrite reductase large subunit
MMKYVIIGNGPAAVNAAEAIREVDRGGSITVLSKEPHLAYGRVFLPQVINGECELNDIFTHPEGYYDQLGCEVVLGRTATGIDRDRKCVHLDAGEPVSYDKLLVATGASASVPEIAGVELDGVSVLRTIDDARNIHKWIRKARRAVVLGAGPVGLHSTEVLTRNGVGVSLVIASKHVLSTIAPKAATAVFEEQLSRAGVELCFGRSVKEIRGDHHVRDVTLDDDRTIACDMVVIGKGVTPNSELLGEPGMAAGAGIRVDARLRTDDPDIYAAGDVIEGYDTIRKEPRLNAMWPNAVSQGRVAGLNMAGRNAMDLGNINLNTGQFFGIPFAVMGLSQPEQTTQSTVRLRDGREYGQLILSEEQHGARRIIGAVLIGKTDGMGVLQTLIRGEVNVAPFIDVLVKSGISYGAVTAWAQGRSPNDSRQLSANPGIQY